VNLDDDPPDWLLAVLGLILIAAVVVGLALK
jgi:hypothetical protein